MAILPLRIPSGFAVCYNRFHDVEPMTREDSSVLKNWDYFTQDLLQITKMEMSEGKWAMPVQQKYVINLGWYPDGEKDGAYTLTVEWGSEKGDWVTKREFSSPDRFEIRETLESWMKEMSNC